MSRILNATLATAFAAACLAGSSMAFAASRDTSHDGNLGNDPNGHQTINRNSPDEMEKLDPGTTGSITTCDRKDAQQNAACGLPNFMK
jgi:hypothetical protein